MANERLIKDSIFRLIKAFNLFKPDPEAVKGFMDIVVEKLRQFPDVIVQRGVERIIETQNFFPKINELMQACFIERDMEMTRLNGIWQDLKDDWRIDVIHPVEDWEKLAGEYRAMYSTGSAKAVMEDYQQYGKLCSRISQEQIAQAKKSIEFLASKN